MCICGLDSLVGVATLWVGGRGSRFSAHAHTDPEDHPTSCKMSNASFPGVKRPENFVEHPQQSLYIYTYIYTHIYICSFNRKICYLDEN
jgi:hypothetical protein